MATTTTHTARSEVQRRIRRAERAGSTRLDLNGIGVASLPEQMRALPGLRTLDLRGNRLDALPDWICDFAHLEELDLSRNRLTELPDRLRGLAGLAVLNVGGNRLPGLPPWLGELDGLTHLYAWGNPLNGALPASLGRLTGLRELTVGKTGLRELPGWVGGLTRLTRLSLRHSRLGKLPEWLRNLTDLEDLDLRDCDLAELPDWLCDLPRLAKLNVTRNPIPDVDPVIVATGDETVLRYLRSTRSSGRVRMWRSRVLVVGDGGVGKTSLIRALSGLGHRPGEPTTHGMSISNLALPHPGETGTAMSLAMWDFGGQPNYQACHQFFFSGRSLFIVVWRTRDGGDLDRVTHWIETVAARAPGAPILVVATHSGDRATDPEASLFLRHPQVVGFRAVDCADPRAGIDELRDLVAKTAAGLPLMGTEWPRSWDKAAMALRNHRSPQIDTEDLWRLMAEAGVDDAVEQRTLTDYLHSLGDVMYPESRSHQIIGDVVTLDAAWLNVRISQVLDSQRIADQGGVLTRPDLRAIWPDLEPAAHDSLLALLGEYDLSYPITDPDDDDALAVVVDRLPRAEPDLAAWHATERDPMIGRIRIRYRLGHGLPGIPAWFIAREYRFSTGLAWQKGVLLRDVTYGDLALLRSLPDGTVDLEVRSRLSAARFFGVLADGHQILGVYPGVEIVREIPCPCQGTPATGCPEAYRIEWILKGIEAGRTEVDCRLSWEKVDLAGLLDGIAPTARALPPAQAGGSRLLDAVREQVQWEFSRALQREVRINKVRCPSVITVNLEKKKLGRTVYQLHLWCDQPGAWHKLPDADSSYRIVEPDRWLRELTPHLLRVATILKATLPVARTALGIMADAIDGEARRDVRAVREHLDKIPAELPRIDDPLAGIDLGVDDRHPAHGARSVAERDSDYRNLERFLVMLDPHRRWGGLNRTVTPEGHVLFLCAKHADRYERHPVPRHPAEMY